MAVIAGGRSNDASAFFMHPVGFGVPKGVPTIIANWRNRSIAFEKRGLVSLRRDASHVPEVRVTDGELDLGFAGNLWVAAFSAIPRIVTDDTLIGDANVDGYVDFVDFLAMSSHFGQAGSWFEGDFNEDEVIDFEDFLLLAKSFGQSTS